MNEKLTVYLETTIPSFLTGRPSNDLILAGKQEVTRRWWETRLNHYQPVISPVICTPDELFGPEENEN